MVVNVINENDNSPLFAQEAFTAGIPEGARVGAIVVQVSTKILCILYKYV